MWAKQLINLGRIPNQNLEEDGPEIQSLAQTYQKIIDSLPEPLPIALGWLLMNNIPSVKFYDIE